MALLGMTSPKPISFFRLNEVLDLRIIVVVVVIINRIVIIIIIIILIFDNAFDTKTELMSKTSSHPKALGAQFQLPVSHRTSECCS